MLNTIDTILTKAYVANCSFAGFNSFRSAMSKYGIINETDSIEFVRENLSRQSQKDTIEDRMFKKVLLRDLDRIISSSADDLFNKVVNEESLMKTMNEYVEILRHLNINITPPEFFVVDKFPAPFDNNEWSAFCPDAEDEKNFGMKKGIYFLRKHIRPYYSEILLAHETIHSLCGQKNPELFAMGLEEGIAELLGSIYLAGKVVGLKIVKNNFVYTRFNRSANLLWSLYTDHCRQMYLLYKQYGLEALVYLIKSGRSEIHLTEKKIFSQQPLSWNFQTKTYLGRDFNELFDYLMLGFTPNYVVTPLQLMLIENAVEGTTIKDISSILDIPMEIARNELSTIAITTSLFMLDGEKIGYSNVDLYRTSNENDYIPIIRYHKEV